MTDHYDKMKPLRPIMRSLGPEFWKAGFPSDCKTRMVLASYRWHEAWDDIALIAREVLENERV